MMKKLVLCVILMVSVPVWATDYVWTNYDADNNFTNTSNWYQSGTTTMPTGPFTSGDNLLIELDGADKAVLSSATAGRWIRAGWNANSVGELDLLAGADADLGNSVYLGYDATAKGTINVRGGSLSATSSYSTIGGAGEGCLNISGGLYHTNRMTVGNNAGGSGQVVLSGTGQLKIDDYLQSNGGDFLLRMEGAGAKIEILDDLITKATATQNAFEFVLDGAAGIGDGIVVSDGILFVAGTTIDLSFMDEAVYGTYTLMTSGGLLDDQTGGSLLSSASAAAGWTYSIVTNEGVSALQVTLVPEPATLGLLLGGGVLLWRKRNNG